MEADAVGGAGMPRWVKGLVVAGVLLVLALLVMHLAGSARVGH